MGFNKSIYIIDDDAIHTIFFKRSIQKLYPTIQIISFLNGEDALMNLLSKVHNNLALPSIIFIDINMPVMDGWEFLEMFTKIDSSIAINIYMVSSSINEEDKNKASAYKQIKGYYSKPIHKNLIQAIIEGV